MAINPLSRVVNVPTGTPHVTLPNGNTVCVIFENTDFGGGPTFFPSICEAAAGTSVFHAVVSDISGIPDSQDMWLDLADALIASGVPMTGDVDAMSKAWLAAQTFATAAAVLGAWFTSKVITRLQSDLATAYPATTSTPTTPGASPADPVALFQYILNQHALSVNPVTSAVTII